MTVQRGLLDRDTKRRAVAVLLAATGQDPEAVAAAYARQDDSNESVRWLKETEHAVEALVSFLSDINAFKLARDTNIDVIQADAYTWARDLFGTSVVNNKQERALRVLEAAIEYAHAWEVSPADMLALVSQVIRKQAGMPKQRLAGVAVTTMVAIGAEKLLMSDLVKNELTRIRKMPSTIRFKQKDKVKAYLHTNKDVDPVDRSQVKPTALGGGFQRT